MKFSRIWVAVLLLLLLAGRLIAQFASDSGDSGGGSTITPSSGGGSGLSLSPSAQSPAESGTATAPATTTTIQEPAQAPIKLPSGYGGGVPSIITPGEGRFAQPPIKFALSLSQGYDDNIFAAPDHPQPTQKVYSYAYELQEQPTGRIIINGGGLGPRPDPTKVLVPVLVATPVDIPPPLPKMGSAITRANLSFQTQAAGARSVYTLDLGLGATDYWSRPGDPLEYNGSVAFLFHYRLTPRSNFTAGGNANTSSQPDFGNLYGPSSNSGQYVSGNFRMNLDYQFTPRISTDLSYSLDTTLYQEATAQSGNLANNTFGLELHYMLSPRATAVFNYRTSTIAYAQSEGSNSLEHFLLFGTDMDLSSRLRFTFRTGVQSKVYDTGGSAGLSSPYFESGLSYVYGKGSTLSWTTRYGFEESPSKSSSQKTVSFRTGAGINQALTGRISANLSMNFNRSVTTSTISNDSTTSGQDQLSLSLGMNYVVNPHLSFNWSYSFNQSLNDQQSYADYTRNQTFLGATYSF